MNAIEKTPLFEEMSLEETDAIQGGLFSLTALGLPIFSFLPFVSTGISLNFPALGFNLTL